MSDWGDNKSKYAVELKEEFNRTTDKQTFLEALKKKEDSAAKLRNAGFNATQLKDAKFNAEELRNAGFNVTQLKKAEFDADELKEAGFDSTELKEVDADLDSLKAQRKDAKYLKKAGFTALQLKNAGFNATEALDELGQLLDLRRPLTAHRRNFLARSPYRVVVDRHLLLQVVQSPSSEY